MTTVFLVGTSRVALGVHSMNQVVYGWSYGLWLAFFLFRFVRPKLHIHIRQLLEKSQFTRVHIPYFLNLALLIWATIIVFTLFNYLIAKRDFLIPPPQLWLDNMLKKCGLVFNENRMFLNPGFIKSGLVSAPIGGYLGLLYDAYYSKSKTPPSINEGPFFYGILRFISGLVVVSPFLLPYLLIGGENWNVYLIYLLKASLPFSLVTFILFAFGK